MTEATTETAPKRLKKRNLGKLATAGVATFAGVALAATTFGLTQPGKAIFDPDPAGTPAETRELSKGDIVFEYGDTLDLGTLEVRAGDTGGHEYGHFAAGTHTTGFQLKNLNETYDAVVRLRSVAPSDLTPEQYSLLNEVYVHIERDELSLGKPVLTYSGPLSQWAPGDYIGQLQKDGGVNTFRVWAWTASTMETETGDPIELPFTIDYQVNDLEVDANYPGNITDADGSDLASQPSE